MKDEAYKLCPACETRNKVEWEICVRCGEWLSDVSVTEPRVERGDAAGSEAGALILGGIGFLAVVVLFYEFGPRLEPAKVDPSAFTAPTMPPPLPTPVPASPPPAANASREGRRLLLAGAHEDAVLRLAQAVALAPEDPQIRNLYAHALWQSGERERALDEFRWAVELDDPRGTYFRNDLAKALAASGRPTDAIAEYRVLIEAQPRWPIARRDLAVLLFGEGQSDEAVEQLTQALALVPADERLHEQLGYILEKSGQPAAALDAYRRAVELAPADVVNLVRLADLLSREGQREESLSLMQSGVARDPESAVLRRGLAVTLERSGRSREAAAAYREYVRLAPDAPDAGAVSARAEALEQRATS
jgi:Flp pilus assembly protein TadD